MTNQPQNVHIGASVLESGHVAICWDNGENRFHVWANPKTLVTHRIIYKNPLIHKNPPTGPTSRLRAGSKTWAPIIAAAIAEVRTQRRAITYRKGPLGYAVLADGKPVGCIDGQRRTGWQVSVPGLNATQVMRSGIAHSKTVFPYLADAKTAVERALRYP